MCLDEPCLEPSSNARRWDSFARLWEPAMAAVPTLHAVGDDAESSLGGAESSLGGAESSLGDAESSLGDVKSSLGGAESSLGDANTSLGDSLTGV